jgi:hypothetical protein
MRRSNEAKIQKDDATGRWLHDDTSWQRAGNIELMLVSPMMIGLRQHLAHRS